MNNYSKPYELFAEQMAKHKHNIAVSDSANKITYLELENKISEFCKVLLNNQLGASDYFAIALPPSIDYITAILSCFKLNVRFIPLELSHPNAYLEKIVNDAEVKFIITNSSLKNRIQQFFHGCCIDINEIARSDTRQSENNFAHETNIAYTIYTSGTTGLPKGVVIHNDSLLNIIQGTRSIYKINSTDRVPLFHSLGFDVSMWEICATLFNGATLVIPPAAKRSPDEYFTFLIESKITIANMTPSFFYLLYQLIVDSPAELLNQFNLRLILLAGEAFHANKIKNWFNLPIGKNIAIYNMYGITEGTIHSTYIKISEEMQQCSASLIGVPLPGIELAVIDESGNAIKENGCGEVYLGGVSIFQGYLNQPELTKTKIVEANFDNTKIKKWFKTGDQVTKKDNAIEYIGRKDNLVKIRGFRVNMGDIETVLYRCDGITGAVVTAFTAADEMLRLIAFLVVDKAIYELTKIKAILHQQLPEYMCPSKFVVVDKFPLTLNGKIDTALLVSQHTSATSRVTDGDLDPLEKIRSVWKHVLNITEVNNTTNFFDAGGDSLLLGKLHYELKQALRCDFKMIDLLKYSTIEKFSDFLVAQTIE